MARKILTRQQAETAKKRAASFLRNVLQDDNRAEEVEGGGLDECAAETGRTITNPRHKGERTMAVNKTKQVLQDELDEANDYIEQLEAKLNDIAGIATDEDEDEDEGEDEGEDDDVGEEYLED